MYVGVQGIGTSKIELEFLRRHGVTHMDSNADAGNLDELVQQRETAAAAGVNLEMIHIPLAESIPLAVEPQRDQDIDEICRWIENAGKSGLRGLNYNVIAAGDSYNDTSMLAIANAGILINPPSNVIDEFPQFPVTTDYAGLLAAIEAAASDIGE